MQYPIFESISKQIESELIKRNLEVGQFRTWVDKNINASGLEIEIKLPTTSSLIKSITINFDWDTFREHRLASHLKGMEKHPLLIDTALKNAKVEPNMDIEIAWHLNQDVIASFGGKNMGTHRLEIASKWMEAINAELGSVLNDDNVISRWHVEVEGDTKGRYLSVMSLMSYFQFSFSELNNINQVHDFIRRRLQYLLIVSNKVLGIAKKTLPLAA